MECLNVIWETNEEHQLNMRKAHKMKREKSVSHCAIELFGAFATAQAFTIRNYNIFIAISITI